jgi:deazaflavin-dependent oxidoreductase (nitroreductase family)
MPVERHHRPFGHADSCGLKLEAAVTKTYTLGGGMKVANTVLKTLVQLGVPSGSMVVVTAPGRKSGQPRSTPVNRLIADGRRYLVAPYGPVGWVQNVRAAGGRAQLKYRGRTENVRLRELPPAEAAPLLKQYIAKNKITAPYFDAKPDDSVERFEAEAPRHPVFEILPG